MLYLICGVSDVLDGYIARRYGWETKSGEKLDSLSDFVFYAIILYLLFSKTDIFRQEWFVICFIVICILRISNLFVTKVKFGRCGVLHSWANKTAGLLLYLYLPFALLSGSILFFPGSIVCVVAIVSAIEEMVILISVKEYDGNRKSYFK